MTPISWIVYDLGNVLLHVRAASVSESMQRLSGTLLEQSAADLSAAVFKSPTWSEMGVREFSDQDIYDAFRNVLPAHFLREHLIESMNAELGETIHETVEVIKRLKKNYRVACLSNTCSVHWRELHRKYEFMALFDRSFASQIMGLAKPGRAIYEAVAKELEMQSNQILFFDDRVENVDGARNAGWNGEVFTTPERMVEDLEKYRISV